MPGSITASKTHGQYFIAIGKQGIHSFIMLGLINAEGKPQLLARVGKTNIVDPDFKNTLKTIYKEITHHTLSILSDEGVSRSKENPTEISYQAYDIHYEQYKEFLELIQYIQKSQNKDLNINPTEITCYIPQDEDEGDQVTFELGTLSSCHFYKQKENSLQTLGLIAAGAQQLHIYNTCRTTALNMMHYVLGFKPDVSGHFLSAPKYKTTLRYGAPDAGSFFVLPPPPTAYLDHSTTQQKVLDKLYRRLEAIPLKKSTASETREKFSELKKIYLDIAGKNQLSANELLAAIAVQENSPLFVRRAPGFLSHFINRTFSTKRLFGELRKNLEREKDSDVAVTPKSEPK